MFSSITRLNPMYVPHKPLLKQVEFSISLKDIWLHVKIILRDDMGVVKL